jgi:hypothetical protein
MELGRKSMSTLDVKDLASVMLGQGVPDLETPRLFDTTRERHVS